MTIQIELDPEFSERLSAEAKARGIALEECAEILLRGAITTRSEPQGNLSVGELRAMLHEIADDSDKLPRVPTSAFTRESFSDSANLSEDVEKALYWEFTGTTGAGIGRKGVRILRGGLR